MLKLAVNIYVLILIVLIILIITTTKNPDSAGGQATALIQPLHIFLLQQK